MKDNKKPFIGVIFNDIFSDFYHFFWFGEKMFVTLHLEMRHRRVV